MSDMILSENELEEYEAIAHQRGYKSLRDYMRVLIEKDAETPEVDDDDELLDPEESFRQAWADAMEGRTMSYEEFRRRMHSDAD